MNDDAFTDLANAQLGARQGETLAVKFFIDLVENEAKTLKEGRAIYDEVETFEIRIPGDPDVRRGPVTAREKERFARHYAAFKASTSQEAVSGTPLEQWSLLKRSQAEEAKFLGIQTVEHLATLSDGNLQRLGPGWMTLRQKAKDWLAQAKDGALLQSLRTELQNRDAKIATLEQMLNKQAAEIQGIAAAQPNYGAVTVQHAQDPRFEQMQAQMAALMAKMAEPAPAPKRRGRPPKAATPE